MSLIAKPCLLALSVIALQSACNTTAVGTAKQFSELEEQAALAMITDTINSQCSAQGFTAGTAEHASCFWEHAAEVREHLALVKLDRLEYSHRMNGAAVISDRKFRDQDRSDARLADERRQEQISRNDGG